MAEQRIRVSVVNFNAEWGNPSANLDKMIRYIEAAQGTDILVFPETALTGYDNIQDTPKCEKMQVKAAEKIPGPSTEQIVKLARKYNRIVVFGMTECSPFDLQTVYNSAAIVKPDGEVLSYRKIHLPDDEGDWATAGLEPMVFDSKWGPIGLSICYDTYSFPELIRYARAKGARLYINCTACHEETFQHVPFRAQLEERALTNQIYIATAGLCGAGPRGRFVGGSSIIGISEENNKTICYYAGIAFGGQGGDAEAIYSADLDLSAIDGRLNTPLFERNKWTGRPDFAPDIYARMYKELAESASWKQKCSV